MKNKEGNKYVLDKFKLRFEDIPQSGFRKNTEKSFLVSNILNKLRILFRYVLQLLKTVYKYINAAVDDMLKW